jgi:CysZ protein
MKSFLDGISYNFKGLKMGLKTPRLLLLGIVRFAVLVMVSVLAAIFILDKYQDILTLMWQRPVNLWLVWVWHLVSWVLALLLMGIAAVIGFLIAQILFSAVIMDWMSQITERHRTGFLKSPPNMATLTYFFYLLRQEIPRAVIPIVISLLFLTLGWFTPFGPVLTILSPLAVGVFLAWDNTDLVPARRLVPFSERLRFLRSHLAFHLGFGVPLLIPVLNLLLLSYAPVGATLYYVEKIDPAP